MPSRGVSLHARTWRGKAEPGRLPAVLVHGLGLSSRYLIPLGRRLGALGYDGLAPDLPGFGRSPRPAGTSWPAAPNVREQTEQLLAWMDAAGIDRAVLFGNSMGVQVAVELAVRHPERVASLILEGPTPDPVYRSPLGMPFLVVNETALTSPLGHVIFGVVLGAVSTSCCAAGPHRRGAVGRGRA